MDWFNPPPQWQQQPNYISLTSAGETDFWRKTHADFIKDDGHFYYETIEGDFTAHVKVTGHYNALYDQAGLMLRLDAENWIKCGVEYVDGQQYASAVVTRDYSDWSVVTIPNPDTIWLKMSRHQHTVEIQYSLDGARYAMLRQSYFPPEPRVMLGVMCCAPKGTGFSAQFEGFQITN